MNKGEYGQVLYINVGESLTDCTFTLVLEPEQGTAIERTESDGVAIGSGAVVVDGVTFNDGEYVSYTVLDGDLTYAGRWRMKLKVQFTPTKLLSTDWVGFVVKG